MTVKRRPSIDADTLRRLATAASCDPRTILAVAQGAEVKGIARKRAHAALVEAGLLSPSTSPEVGHDD